MTNRELKQYINNFPDDAGIVLILANPKERKLYEVVNSFGIIGEEQPIFCIEVGKVSPMDADLVRACIDDEQRASMEE